MRTCAASITDTVIAVVTHLPVTVAAIIAALRTREMAGRKRG